MNKMTEKEWNEEFQEFVQCEGAPIPDSISEKIFDQVRRDLNPSGLRVFAKLLGVHAIVGTLSLAICNQFGLNPFGTGVSLSDYFMKFGNSACMVLCGVLFVGLSLTVCRFVIHPEELGVLRRNIWLQVSGLSLISLGAFMAFGAVLTLTIGILWLLGAMIAGTVVTVLPFHRFRSA